MKKPKKSTTPTTRDKKIRELVIEELQLPTGGADRPCECIPICKCFVRCQSRCK